MTGDALFRMDPAKPSGLLTVPKPTPSEAVDSPARMARYPLWAQDLILESREAKEAVTRHEAWRLMSEGTISRRLHRIMLVGFWPLIEKFPHFLSLNLLKTTQGRDAGVNAARTWLARNLRAEAKHAEWYLDWAEGLGVGRDEMFDGAPPVEMAAIAEWCWRISHVGGLAEGMVATNYAVEGATGEWVREVAPSEPYRRLFAPAAIDRTMRWLEAHADYDASHPFEALDIIAQLLGADPPRERLRGIRHAVTRSYELYRLALDVALERGGTETT